MITASEKLKSLRKLDELKEKRFSLIVDLKETDIRLAGTRKCTKTIDWKDRTFWVKHRMTIELQVIKIKQEIKLLSEYVASFKKI